MIYEEYKNLDKKRLEGMVWRLIEEIFNPSNMEEVKQRLALVVIEVLNVVC